MRPPSVAARIAASPVIRERWWSASVARRLPKLIVGLLIFGAGIGVQAEAGLGLGPWEALHQGIARQTGIELGTVSILLGVPILLAWWPLGERPGIGTVLNIVLIGLATNAAIAVLPAPGSDQLWLQLVMMATGVVMIGVASGIYLATDLGAGPRDGLMTGLHRRFGWSISRARTGLELTVLVIGFLLGGTVGLGTVAFALGIGPIVQWSLSVFDLSGVVARRRAALHGVTPADVPEAAAE
ncbi:MAG: hypothetical protein FJ038_12620 [Chloroflexi bacterium]|nr:hypothetical protein [Chloroflexota bacterium]